MSPELDYESLVARLYADDPIAWEELYGVVNRFRGILAQRIPGGEVEDRLHDAYILVTKEIRKRSIRFPATLPCFIRRIVVRCAFACIEEVTKRRERIADIDASECGWVADSQADSPEAVALEAERWEVKDYALSELSPEHRELLERFYVREQPMETICREMGIDDTQFRNWKHRARERASAAVQNRLGRYGKRQDIRIRLELARQTAMA